MDLAQTHHEYYCECWESSRTTEYKNWKEFVEKEVPYDLDYNLLFRFDLDFHDKDMEQNNGMQLFTILKKQIWKKLKNI